MVKLGICLLFVVQALGMSVDKTINSLAERVAKSQVRKGTKFFPPFSYYNQFGSYPSEIKINFNGILEAHLLRDGIGFLDSNCFVTLWINIILLEAQRYSPKPPAPSEEQLRLALSAISSYHDRNRAFNESIFVFWPQSYNSSTDAWVCGPVNLGGLAREEAKFNDFIEKLLNDLGLEFLWKKIGAILQELNGLVKAFRIPADFDDTLVNVGLGAILANQRDNFPDAYTYWLQNNTNLEFVFESIKKYSYRPFDNSSLDAATIDPRSYFYLREFLYEVANDGYPISLVSTWVENISEDRVLAYKGVAMPFNLNNVDLTVTANVLYGITSAILSQLQLPTKAWFDEDLQAIYLNSSNLIMWQINHNFSSRPDLALTYYPSVYNFFWFVSRTVNLLNSAANFTFPVMAAVKKSLTSALRGAGTKFFLTSVQHDSKDPTLLYFDDFLGNGDVNIEGKPVKHGEDRLMATSMAVNTLCYTWSEGGQLISSIPKEVSEIIQGASEWLKRNVLDGSYKPYNVFFSGSVKAQSDLPFYYPSNYAAYLNGTVLPPWPQYKVTYDSNNVIIGVRGVIPKDQYEDMLMAGHYGYFTEVDFHGYNAGMSDSFPFWSSEPLTYSSVLLALTQYRHYLPESALREGDN